MTEKKLTASIIYNPMAGFSDWENVIENITEYWEGKGWSISLSPTEHAGHATELAQEAAVAGQTMVLAAGGDGTLNEIANGLISTQTILAPLPVGTSNSFAKEIGLPRPNVLQPSHLVDASKKLMRGRVQQLDCGRTQSGRHWLLWASTGIDGFVVEQIEPRARWFKRLGPVGYLARALFFLPQFDGFHGRVTVDGREIEDEFLMVNVSNVRMWMGGELLLNGDAVLDDGLFEVWVFRGKHWPKLLSYGIGISTQNHVRNRDVTVLRGKSIAIHTDAPMPYHLDGEPTDDTPLTVDVVPSALSVLVPDSVPQGLFHNGGKPAADLFGDPSVAGHNEF